MKKLVIIFPICLALACAAAGCSKSREKKTNLLMKPQAANTNAAEAPIDLKVKWNPGQRYTLRLEVVLGADVTLPNTNQPRKFVVALGHTYSVLPGKHQSDGGQELDVEMVAQRSFIQVAERNSLAFDSRQNAEEDAADPISPLLRKLLNVPVKCFTDVDGKLARAEGLDALLTSLPEGNATTKAAIQKIFTEQNLSTAFAFLAAAQPVDAKKIGESWPLHLESGAPGTSDVVLDAHLKAASWDAQDNRECVRIDFQGDVSVKPGATNKASEVTIDGGTFTGTAWFDPELGTLLNSSVVGHLTAKIPVEGQLQPTRVNISSNLRLLTLEEQ